MKAMPAEISRETLARLSEHLKRQMGLYFPENRWDELREKMAQAMKDFDCQDLSGFIERLMSTPLSRQEIEMLASHLTISETYFWREPRVFEALEKQILPELIRVREKGERRLRIWSAGCASGEEPYSIAIALRRALPVPEDWRITILATDINPGILRRATAGVYGQWSFRGLPKRLKEECFHRKEDGRFEILPEIRKMVTFTYLNLVEDLYPLPLNNTNAMDLIFCRNVLMYFTPERAVQVGQRLYNSLVDDGWLMVGASELSQFTFPQFASVHFPGAIVYRKETGKSRPSEVFRPDGISSPKEKVQPAGESATGIGKAAGLPLLREKTRIQVVESASPKQAAYAEVLDRSVQGRDMAAPVKQQGEEATFDITFRIRALADQGKLAEALSACDEAIAADKLDPEMHYLRAAILQELNEHGEAIAALKRALYLDPKFVPAHFAIGNLMLRQGNARAAKKSFENVLALLSACRAEDILPELEGLTAGRCREIIHATIRIGASA
ncbi:MAG: tetratricopeptide repeat protein [Syntrophales bacterium]|jgi:chemotaxis protein methyltransferase CheR|nr:tetratricopeptide repeat protein [Syntrophales bacterium]